MKQFNIENVDKKVLYNLGLLDNNGKIKLSKEEINNLENGAITDLKKFENVMAGKKSYDMEAKLHLGEEEGKTTIFVLPKTDNPKETIQLSDEEKEVLQQEIIEKNYTAVGKVVDFGEAPYQNKKDAKESFFIKIENNKGQVNEIWGKELKNEVKDNKIEKDDLITLEHKGMEAVKVKNDKGEFINAHRNSWEIEKITHEKQIEIEKLHEEKKKEFLVEYDNDTKTYVAMDKKDAPNVTHINNKELNEQQKKDLNSGKAIKLGEEEEDEYNLSPKKKGMNINAKKALIGASFILDGGLSFFLYHAIKKINNEAKYRQLKNLEKKLDERMKQNIVQNPNDPSKKAQEEAINKVQNLKLEVSQQVFLDNHNELKGKKEFTEEDVKKIMEDVEIYKEAVKQNNSSYFDEIIGNEINSEKSKEFNNYHVAMNEAVREPLENQRNELLQERFKAIDSIANSEDYINNDASDESKEKIKIEKQNIEQQKETLKKLETQLFLVNLQILKTTKQFDDLNQKILSTNEDIIRNAVKQDNTKDFVKQLVVEQVKEESKPLALQNSTYTENLKKVEETLKVEVSKTEHKEENLKKLDMSLKSERELLKTENKKSQGLSL